MKKIFISILLFLSLSATASDERVFCDSIYIDESCEDIYAIYTGKGKILFRDAYVIYANLKNPEHPYICKNGKIAYMYNNGIRATLYAIVDNGLKVERNYILYYEFK